MNNMRVYRDNYRGVYFVLNGCFRPIMKPTSGYDIPMKEATLQECIVYDIDKLPKVEEDKFVHDTIYLPILLNEKFVLYIKACLDEKYYLSISFKVVFFEISITKIVPYIEIIQNNVDDNFDMIRQIYFPVITNYYKKYKLKINTTSIKKNFQLL